MLSYGVLSHPKLFGSVKVPIETNKTGMCQVGAISKAQMKSKGDPWRQKFKKKSHSAKKIERGDPLHSSSFVGYVQKVKNQRGGSFGDKEKFEKKVAQCRKKIEMGTL